MKTLILRAFVLLSVFQLSAAEAKWNVSDHRLLAEFIQYLESQDETLMSKFSYSASSLLHTEGWYEKMTVQPLATELKEFVTTDEEIEIKLIHESIKMVFGSELTEMELIQLTRSLLTRDAVATREILGRTNYFAELHSSIQSRKQSELSLSSSDDPKQILERFKHYNDPVIVFGHDLGTFKVEYHGLRSAIRDLADQDIVDWALPLLSSGTTREELLMISKFLLQSQKLKSTLTVLKKVTLPLSLEEENELLSSLRGIVMGWYGSVSEADLLPVMQLILSQNPMSGSFYAEFEAMINRAYPNSTLLTEFRKFKLSPLNISTTLALAKIPQNIECKSYAIRKNKYKVPYLRVVPLGVMNFTPVTTSEAFSAQATAQSHWSERIDTIDVSYDLTLTYHLSQDPRVASKVVPELKFESHTKRKQNLMGLEDDMKSEMPGYQMAQLEYELPEMSLVASGNYIFTRAKSKNLYAMNVLCSNESKYFQVAEEMYRVVADQLQKDFVKSLNLPDRQ